MSGYEDHLLITDTTIGPQPWMQLRLVASEEVASVSRSYDVSDGEAKDDLLQTLNVEWTNTSPVEQWVYGMVTKSGSKVTLQCRSRGYISTTHAVYVGWSNPSLGAVEVSRFGVGSDLGNGGLLKIGGAYAISELRQNSQSTPFIPHVTGWNIVRPGETIWGEVVTSFVSEDWENTQIEGGDGDTESSITTGDIRLDLFAVPALVGGVSRSIPTVVGIEYDQDIDTGIFGNQTTDVDVPAGVIENDVLVAIVANNVGLWGAVEPQEEGWALLHSRAASKLGSTDVHLKVYVRLATGSEPAQYSFSNALLSEQTSVIIAIRNAVFDPLSYSDWYAASTVSKFKWKEEHIAPTIDRTGQMLICFSFFSHALTQNITQTSPTGMTEILDVDGQGTSLAVAYLANPPRPSRQRTFYPSAVPHFNGHSISGSIVIPGVTVIESE